MINLDKYNYSVLMSVYRGESPDNLTQSLNSVINMSKKPKQIVVVKDGELTQELDSALNEFGKKYNKLFKIISFDKNKGLGNALKAGLLLCSEEFVARMDSDDICHESRAEKQLEYLVNNPDITIVGSDIEEFLGSIQNTTMARVVPETHDEILQFARRRNPFNHPSIMFRKEDIINVGNYSDWEKCQDYELYLRLFSNGYKGYNIKEPLIYMRADNLYNKRKSKKSLKYFIKARKKAYDLKIAKWYDYVIVVAAQLILYAAPIKFTRKVYDVFLRTKNKNAS